MKDIIESLKIRINNPIIISFLISWLFWNWQIFLSLCWYNSANLERWTGYKNYFDLIIHYSNWQVSFIYPLISALIYTFGFPILKWGLSSFYAYFSTKEESNVLEISKKGYVSTHKYVEAIQKAEDQIKSLSEIINNETMIIQENNEYREEIAKLNRNLAEKNSEMENLYSSSKVEALNGIWKLIITRKNNNKKFESLITINDGEATIKENALRKEFYVKNYIINTLTSNISLCLALQYNSHINQLFEVEWIIITSAQRVGDIIESDSDNVSDFYLRMEFQGSKHNF